MIELVKGNCYKQTYKEQKLGKKKIPAYTVTFVVEEVTANNCLAFSTDGEPLGFAIGSPFHLNCVAVDLPKPPVLEKVVNPCRDCGKAIGKKRVKLNFQNCLACSSLNDAKVYSNMAKRIVPAAHKGHMTYVRHDANRGFIETMMKK